MSARLLLEPEPQSVRRARVWIGGELERLGRPDLVDAAELGISELVTNAILHAEPPISVRLRGSRDRPRVEVHDNSGRPPRVGVDMTDDDHLMATIGRGMGIVALYSQSWGADVSQDGKVVWFVPSGDPGVDVAEEGDVYDLAEAVEEAMADAAPVEKMVTIRLLGMPAQVFASFRGWYSEIRRELRLLSFDHDDRYPVADELGELMLQVEHERRLARGIERLNQAIVEGLESVDLEYVVPATASTTMARMREVLERADRFCRDQSLLTVAATPQQLELMRWYSDEFVRQGAGREPRPWPGSTLVDHSTG
jgi:anti-sigma regulatory factor (Ser/Thr protein kinase)